MIGKQIQRYEITDHLGAGAVAEVYLAHQVFHNEIVAIKLFRPELCIPDPEWAGRFYRDAEIATGLRHPGVMRTLDAGKDDERFYLVLEYIEGATLRDTVGLQGHLDVERALGLMRAAAGGLDYLHAQGVTHANLTSTNIMIRGADGTPVIADFSIFRSVWRPEYASPEQAAGGAVGPASDMFSLGIIFYEMLIGRVPYFGELPPAAAMRHAAYLQRAVQDVARAAGAHAAAIIERLLCPDADRRFASGAELIEAIDTPAISQPPPLAAMPQQSAPPAFRAAPLVPELSYHAPPAQRDTNDPADHGARMLGIWATGILGVIIVTAAVILMVRSGPQKLLLPGVNRPVEKYTEEEDENTRAANIRPGLPTTERSEVPADDAAAAKAGEKELPDEEEKVQELITIDEENVDPDSNKGTTDELFGDTPSTTPGAAPPAAAGGPPAAGASPPGTAPPATTPGAGPQPPASTTPPETKQPKPLPVDPGTTF